LPLGSLSSTTSIITSRKLLGPLELVWIPLEVQHITIVHLQFDFLRAPSDHAYTNTEQFAMDLGPIAMVSPRVVLGQAAGGQENTKKIGT
jgi:hypothetical protein